MSHLPHTMLERTLWIQALIYSQTLYPGAIVDPAIDGAYIEPFKWLLPLAMEVHGLRLEGTTVVKMNELEGRA